jgi:multicomponent Na+:H+ antiporter subunit D
MERLLVLPVLIPLFTAISLLLLRRNMGVVRVLAFSGSGLSLLTAGYVLMGVIRDRVWVTTIGGWPAPYGITLAVDLLGAIMLAAAALVGTFVLIYSIGCMDADRERAGFYVLLHFLLMGVNGSLITGDLFNLYVFFEVMLVSSFGLMTLGGERAQLEGGLKYVVINMVSSILFVTALGILYGTMGTLNMADLSVRLGQAPDGLVTVLASMFLITFGIKAGLFPLFFWLPASYHTPPAAISAIFAGLLTKVGVYALIRVFTLLFWTDSLYLPQVVMVIAGLTMVTGVLGAVAQYDFRRLLAFHIISQIGYMIMGLAFFSPLGLAGAIYHIVHNMIIKTNLFLVSGIVERSEGTPMLKQLGGMLRSRPLLAGIFLISALALAGLPPFSGFISKFMLVKAGLDGGHYAIVSVSLVVSILTLFSMTKIWNEVFWKPAPDMDGQPANHVGEIKYEIEQSNSKRLVARTGLFVYLPAILLAILSIGMGLWSEPLVNLATRAAEVLLDPRVYVSAVLLQTGVQ